MNKALELMVEVGSKFTTRVFLSDAERDDIFNRAIYRGTTKPKQYAYLKDTYKGKGPNGGRACKMVTPASYKNRPNPWCITWGTMPVGTPCWKPESPTDPRVLADADNASMEELESAERILDSLH